MIHITSYSLFESLSKRDRLIEVCDSLLEGTSFWNNRRFLINPSIELVIDQDSERTAHAHFDRNKSTHNTVFVQMDGYPETKEEKGTLAHELVHVIQWLLDEEGDLMFITDVTRELEGFSSSETWQRLMFAIYLSCPQEEEAWKMEQLYKRERVLDEIIPWMREFDSSKVAEELLNNPPEDNRWGMESFESLPSDWVEAYKLYGEVKEESDIPSLENLTLVEFLSHYGKRFRKTARLLS